MVDVSVSRGAVQTTVLRLCTVVGPVIVTEKRKPTLVTVVAVFQFYASSAAAN